MTATAPSCHHRTRGTRRIIRPQPAMIPQPAGGRSRKARPENTVIPAMLPMMSSR
jgi:hypothetical protein